MPQGASRRLFLFATTQSKAIGVPPTRSCGCLWYPAGVTSAPPCRERRNRRLVRAASSLTVVSAERQGLECFTFPETHLPNALDLFAFVPYLVLKAAGSAFRSAQQALAAFVVAFSC